MLTRRDPFREMMTLRSAMDRLLENAFVGPQFTMEGSEQMMSMDVTENENEFVVKTNIPGVKPDDLDITYNNNLLTIKAEVKEEKETEDARYHMRERRIGSYSRSITLPTAVQSDRISANCENGILTLHLPKAEEARPRRIQVQNQKTIEG